MGWFDRCMAHVCAHWLLVFKSLARKVLCISMEKELEFWVVHVVWPGLVALRWEIQLGFWISFDCMARPNLARWPPGPRRLASASFKRRDSAAEDGGGAGVISASSSPKASAAGT